MAKPRTSSKAPKPKPFTPIRRLFFRLDLFRPMHALGKRRRGPYEFGPPDPVVDTPPEKSPARTHTHPDMGRAPQARGAAHQAPAPHKPACVALQNEDAAEDAVIITALDTIPFCCHEDLLTMPREKLISVALSLNAKLPGALSIDVSHTRPDSFIRNAIELVVGLRGDVPLAPKAARSWPEDAPHLMGDFDAHLAMNMSPPTSPLSRRGRSSDLYTSIGSPKLERLEEEEEESDPFFGRPIKKRKVSLVQAAFSPDVDMEATPTPLQRTKSTPGARSGTPVPTRVLRSHSQKLPDEMKNIKIDTAFITTTRPRYRYRNKAKEAKGDAGSTTRGARLLITPSRTSTPRKIRARPISSYQAFAAPHTVDAPTSTSAASSPPHAAESPASPAKKRKRSIGETDRKMASGMGEMHMGISTSDMDVTA